jgi:RNA polymerase sigma-70 factor (ECF subfamily)
MPDSGRSEAASAASTSLREVYDEHYGFVWRTVQRLGVADEAVDDAVQDVFVVVARRLDEFEGRSAMRTWLYAITKRVVMHYHRANFRLRRRKDAVATGASTSTGGGFERAEAARDLHRLLQNIDEDQREVFVLAELEGLTAPEISEVLGVKQATIYSRLRSARIKLEKAAARLRDRETEDPS